MTDKEIIQALECCIKSKTNADCEALKCPFYDNEIDICMYVNNEEVIYANALDLITRQQAEIERLRELIDVRHKVFETKCAELEIAKSEAIKEFAGKIADVFYSHDKGDTYVREVVYNLVKEMVGEK